MKLNRRAALVILPVLSICFITLFASIYKRQSQHNLEAEIARANVEAGNLRLEVERYVNFGESALASLLQSKSLQQGLSVEDRRFQKMSLDRVINTVLNSLTPVAYSELSLQVLDAQLQPIFYFEAGEDPFAEIDLAFADFVREAALAPNLRERGFLRTESTDKLVFLRRIDLQTMRPPLHPNDSGVVLIALSVDMPVLMHLFSHLETQYGYRVSIEPQQNQEVAAGVGEVRLKVWDLLDVVVAINMQTLAALQDQLALKLLVRFVAMMLFSGWVLMALIKHYITGPMHNLQTSIAKTIKDNEPLPTFEGANDEVSLLGKEFSRLYTRLSVSFAKTRTMAATDHLTKLYNRYTFTRLLKCMISRASRNNSSIALLYIDLDNFKVVNDRHGHSVGDVVLKEFAKRLCAEIRVTDMVSGGLAQPSDSHSSPQQSSLQQSALQPSAPQQNVARLAGDEFTVLLPEFKTTADLARICGRILKMFDRGFETPSGRFPLGASIGIAVFPADGDSAEALTSSADTAMYQAKSAGRNQFKFYSSDLASKSRRIEDLENELSKQPFDEFTLHYMPIYNHLGQVKAVEALIRWHSPVLGQVSPAEFIPIAEAKGLYEALDFWVIQRALDDLPRVQEVFGRATVVSINISSAQLNSGEFFLRLLRALQEREVDVRLIQLEITETFAADMSERVEANLNLFKQAGLTLALDDFGTGYTSLTQLVDYPLDVIKIDKSLIDRMVDERRRDMVLALVSFCKQQGFSVTAEGIETEEQVDTLKAAGVDGLQGFFLAKPQPLESFAEPEVSGG